MKLKKLLWLALFLMGAQTLMAQSWAELGTGTNALNANHGIIAMTTDATGNVWAGGRFSNAAGQYYVAKWNGSSWAELGTGTNALNANDWVRSIVVDPAGNVYAAGDFTNASGKQYVAKWDGNSWTELGSGANALNANWVISNIALDPTGNIYAAGFFKNAAGKCYVAKWNGTTWSELGTGANALNANNYILSVTTDPSGNIYAGGFFTNASGKQYVAKWNGTTWAELGTGANALNPTGGSIISIAADPSGNIYTAGYFTNAAGNNYVAKWNGTSWAELGTGANALNANGSIRNISVDPAGNVYTAGDFRNATGSYYVAKWDGSSWAELGTGTNALNATGNIIRIASDQLGNFYASGYFANSAGNRFVAKFTPPVPVDSIDVRTVGNVPAVITANAGQLPMTAVVFPATANQAVTWSIVPGTGTANITPTGVVSALTNGTVWAKAVSVANTAKKDSLLINISNQVVAVDSIDVRTVGNVPATITANAGQLPMTAVVFPATASQDVTWSIVPGTGTANITPTGVVSALTNGTVWAKAVSVANTAKKDSLLINISNQAVAVDSIDVRTVGNVPAVINTNAGFLPMTAVVFPATASQAVTWSIVPGTGTANISTTGVVNALTNGTVWAKAVSVSNTSKMDSLLITITKQGSSIKDKMATMGIKVYPNPADREIYLVIEQAHDALEVTVTDLSGRALMHNAYTANSLNHPKAISLKDMAQGIYFLQLKGKDLDLAIQFIKK